MWSGGGDDNALRGGGGGGGALAVPLWRALLVLSLSIALIGLLVSIIVSLSSLLVGCLGVGKATIGATLVAFGSEIPDTISAIALARSGYNDGAMSGAIGSQVINISLGVGLPALLVCAFGRSGEFRINAQQTQRYANIFADNKIYR